MVRVISVRSQNVMLTIRPIKMDLVINRIKMMRTVKISWKKERMIWKTWRTK